MATITQNPWPTKFVGDMQDLVLSSQDSVEFQLKLNSSVILKETYNPAGNVIRIGGLGKVLETCLYGSLKYNGAQSSLSGIVDIVVDGTIRLSKKMYVSHNGTSADIADQKTILSHGNRDVCYPDIPHPLTFIGTATAVAKNAAGTTLATVTIGATDSVMTVDCDPEDLFGDVSGLIITDIARIVYTCGGDTFTSEVDHRNYRDCHVMLFLNMYDAPEALLVKVAMDVKPQSTDDVGTSYEEDRRYHIAQQDEYTADSGTLHSRVEYALWRDLVMSRKVSVRNPNDHNLIPVIITKTNYKQKLRKGDMGNITFTFRMARERDNGLLNS